MTVALLGRVLSGKRASSVRISHVGVRVVVVKVIRKCKCHVTSKGDEYSV